MKVVLWRPKAVGSIGIRSNTEAAVSIDYEKGHRLMRPHWHWVQLGASEKLEDKLALFDDDGHERGPYKPSRSDKTATDWVLVK
jgi:hypothetical protein